MSTVRHRASGFTLIEIALVLFIGGILLAGAIGLATTLVQNAREKATRESIQIIKLAIQSYVGRTGKLPCPAVYTDVESAITFGTEAPSPGTCTGTVDLGPGLAKYGTLPWKTLGLSAGNAFDGWNNQFSYAVTTAATSTTLLTAGAMRGALSVHTTAPIAPGLPGPPANGNQINACSTTAGDNSCNLLASIVLISHGPNGLGAYSRAGTAVPLPSSVRELVNSIISAAPAVAKTSVAFVNADYSEVTANYFDDIVTAWTPADVLSTLVAQGGVKLEYATLQEKYRLLVAALATSAVANRSGSIGTYSYPVPAATGATTAYAFGGTWTGCSGGTPTDVAYLPTSMQVHLDPWGNPFRYKVATANIMSSTSCPWPAVIVSAGPDGNIATTSDNTVYPITLAEFQAVLVLSGW